MAENRNSGILPYCFEPESVSSLTVDDSSSSESEMDGYKRASKLHGAFGEHKVREVYSHAKWYRVSVLQGNGGHYRAYGCEYNL